MRVVQFCMFYIAIISSHRFTNSDNIEKCVSHTFISPVTGDPMALHLLTVVIVLFYQYIIYHCYNCKRGTTEYENLKGDFSNRRYREDIYNNKYIYIFR